MRLLFIRHGDPDYEHDTLTEKGRREAELLAKAAPFMDLGTCFVSPYGRARDTAAYCLEATGKTAQTLDWLKEFPSDLDLNRSVSMRDSYPSVPVDGVIPHKVFWDMYPSSWNGESIYLDPVKWRECPLSKECSFVSTYDEVTWQLDSLLASYGYVRDGCIYRVERESHETLTFFCHFGITCALISHIWGVSPFTLWFHSFIAPTGVSELVTEERKEGIAHFRSLRIGDISHLYAGGEEPSFSGRFRECYHDFDKRN